MSTERFAVFAFRPASQKAWRKGRVIALCRFDFDAYEYTMKIDRVRLGCELAGGKRGRAGTQFAAVQRLVADTIGKTTWVSPLTATEDGRRSCTTFSINLQDPTLDQLIAVQDRIRAEFGLVSCPALHEIEIALDMKPRKGCDSEAALNRALVMCRRHLLPRLQWTSGNQQHLPRMVDGNRVLRMHLSPYSERTPAMKDYLHATCYLGERGSNVEYRIYRKTLDCVRRTDTGTKEGTAIRLDEQVVRTEVTLREEAIRDLIGGSSLTELKASGLRGMRKYFQFATPILPGWEHLSGVRRVVVQRHAAFLLNECFARKGAWWFAATATPRNCYQPLKGDRLVVHPELSRRTRDAHRRLQSSLLHSRTLGVRPLE